MATRRRPRAAKKPARSAKPRPKQKAMKKRPAAKRASKAPRARKANPKVTAPTKQGSPKTTSRRTRKPAAFDEAETQKVPAAEVVEDIEIQLSLDLLPNG